MDRYMDRDGHPHTEQHVDGHSHIYRDKDLYGNIHNNCNQDADLYADADKHADADRDMDFHSAAVACKSGHKPGNFRGKPGRGSADYLYHKDRK